MKHLTPRQQEILNVALDLFHKRGYADTSMRDIAEVMNVKAASLYAHIKSKEEIMEWICEDVRNRLMQKNAEINTPGLSYVDKIRILVTNHLEAMFYNVKSYDVFFTNIYRLKVDFKEQNKYFQIIISYRDFSGQIIKNYLTSLGVKDDDELELTTKLALSVLNNVYRHIPEENFDLKKHYHFLSSMLLYGAIGKK
ncbi:TetR/AcrR family transcriptional regulator [Cloacibacterium sp. TD35]|uniref:TetR/AcrR family transcriptional regulator n=1 Tax=Cloacibacterium sp. TD35 TaxID=2976818 RepID=UPI00237E84F7|nr:TetR/AcrR family transcriptional regulator [Cloacibacterium sp. TD35]WDT68277.1 TetR/AcrR family transcriptional regulator [Cloacibacterium sp. TD35]